MNNKLDYSAISTVWVLPWKNWHGAQTAEFHRIPFSDAITVLIGLPPKQQAQASIEIHGKEGRIGLEEALAITHRDDFPTGFDA
jgi:hypothetical protein